MPEPHPARSFSARALTPTLSRKREREKDYSAASTRFLRLDADPRASTGLRNCPV